MESAHLKIWRNQQPRLQLNHIVSQEMLSIRKEIPQGDGMPLSEKRIALLHLASLQQVRHN